MPREPTFVLEVKDSFSPRRAYSLAVATAPSTRKTVLRTLGGWAALFVAGPLVSVLSSQACLAPTQVTVVLETRTPCAPLRDHGTSIAVDDEPRGAEDKATSFVSASTRQCSDGNGHIGTLVVTPSDDGSRAAVVVVAGIDQNAEDCKEANQYRGCIVARRQFSFIDHKSLTLPITLDPSCLNLPCNALSTCDKGVCVSSETRCRGDLCNEVGTSEDGGAIPFDASGVDGPVIVPDGGPDDGSVTDGSPQDGSTNDGSSGDGGACGASNQPVDCGGMNCPGLSCCRRALSPFTSDCRTSCDLPTWGLKVSCTARKNCPEGQYCCWNNNSFGEVRCETACAMSTICEADCDCPLGNHCDTTPAVYQRTCVPD